jgi:hypothetical protein
MSDFETIREARRKAHEIAKVEQEEADKSEFLALEDDHGYGSVHMLPGNKFTVGVPTMAIMRSPTGDEYKRYTSQIRGSKGEMQAVGRAQDLLARSCWLYPASKEAQSAFLEAYPGALSAIVMKAISVSDLRVEAEGKE